VVFLHPREAMFYLEKRFWGEGPRLILEVGAKTKGPKPPGGPPGEEFESGGTGVQTPKGCPEEWFKSTLFFESLGKGGNTIGKEKKRGGEEGGGISFP